MEAKFSPRVKDVITYSREEALRLGHDYIGIEHLMLGMIRDGDGVGMRLLKNLGVDAAELRRNIEQNLTPGLRKTNNLANIPLVKQAEKTLKLTYLEAKTFKSVQIGTEHLLLCILKEHDNKYKLFLSCNSCKFMDTYIKNRIFYIFTFKSYYCILSIGRNI